MKSCAPERLPLWIEFPLPLDPDKKRFLNWAGRRLSAFGRSFIEAAIPRSSINARFRPDGDVCFWQHERLHLTETVSWTASGRPAEQATDFGSIQPVRRKHLSRNSTFDFGARAPALSVP